MRVDCVIYLYASNLINSGIANVSGTNNVYLGHAACGNGAANTNEIVIGANAVGAGSNSVVLGSTATTKTVLYGAVAIGGVSSYGTSGQLLTSNGAAAPAWSSAIGAPSPATTATTGFVQVPVMAGQPTGTPTVTAGYAPMVVDSTGSKLWFYVGGAWKSATLA